MAKTKPDQPNDQLTTDEVTEEAGVLSEARREAHLLRQQAESIESLRKDLQGTVRPLENRLRGAALTIDDLTNRVKRIYSDDTNELVRLRGEVERLQALQDEYQNANLILKQQLKLLHDFEWIAFDQSRCLPLPQAMYYGFQFSKLCLVATAGPPRLDNIRLAVCCLDEVIEIDRDGGDTLFYEYGKWYPDTVIEQGMGRGITWQKLHVGTALEVAYYWEIPTIKLPK